MISTGQVVHFTENIMELIDALEPSFFEVTVAMAFDHFAKEEVDVAIIETGLGAGWTAPTSSTPKCPSSPTLEWTMYNCLGIP